MQASSKLSEKRLFRTRSKCPKPLQDNLMRAATQKFSVLALPQLPDDWPDRVVLGKPTKDRSKAAVDLDLVGSTGNVYSVTLDFRPTCTCPNFAKKEDICKHIFFVLQKIVGLSRDSPILYQRAYLSTELIEIYDSLYDSLESSNIGGRHVAAPKIRAEYNKRSIVSKIGTELCDQCGKRLDPKTHRSSDAIRCPRRHCGGVFHSSCVLMPDLDRLTLDSTSREKKPLIRTTKISCPLCDTMFDHDEGYVNIADLTGQSRSRDTSTYRPCPGYPGYPKYHY